jgi:hypothetical protein
MSMATLSFPATGEQGFDVDWNFANLPADGAEPWPLDLLAAIANLELELPALEAHQHPPELLPADLTSIARFGRDGASSVPSWRPRPT